MKNDPARTILNAPLLCGGDFFSTPLLCWDLGDFHYLYYSPADLPRAGLITGNAELAPLTEGFYLIRYPDLSAVCRKLWYWSGIMQGATALFLLAMFLWAFKLRRTYGDTGYGD